MSKSTGFLILLIIVAITTALKQLYPTFYGLIGISCTLSYFLGTFETKIKV
jgi:hypothetical protein